VRLRGSNGSAPRASASRTPLAKVATVRLADARGADARRDRPGAGDTSSACRRSVPTGRTLGSGATWLPGPGPVGTDDGRQGLQSLTLIGADLIPRPLTRFQGKMKPPECRGLGGLPGRVGRDDRSEPGASAMRRARQAAEQPGGPSAAGPASAEAPRRSAGGDPRRSPQYPGARAGPSSTGSASAAQPTHAPGESPESTSARTSGHAAPAR
jgi:hypothetical protein